VLAAHGGGSILCATVPETANASVTKVWNESIVDYSARNIGAFKSNGRFAHGKAPETLFITNRPRSHSATTSGYDVFVFAERDIIAAQSFVAANFGCGTGDQLSSVVEMV